MIPTTNPRYFANVIAFYAFLTSIPIMFYLIYLINYYTPFVLKPFKRILILYIVVDSYLTFCGLIIYTNHASIQNGNEMLSFIFINGLIQYPSKYVTLILAAFNQCAMYWTISSVASIFIYRYIYICRSHLLKSIGFTKITLTSLILPIMIFAKVLYEYFPDQNYDSYMVYFNSSDWIIGNSMPVYAVTNNLTEPFSLLFGFCSLLIPFTISLTCAYRITRKLKQLKCSTTIRRRKMQNDVTKILTIQLFLPFFGFGIPLFLRQCSMLFHITLPSSIFFSYIVVWSPTINSLFIIAIIEPYKLKTIAFIKSAFYYFNICRFKKSKVSMIKMTARSGDLK